MFKIRLIIRVYDGPDNEIWENKKKGDLGHRIFQACPMSEEFIWRSAVLENGRLWQAPRNFLNHERVLGAGEAADKAGLRKRLEVEFFPGTWLFDVETT